MEITGILIEITGNLWKLWVTYSKVLVVVVALIVELVLVEVLVIVV